MKQFLYCIVLIGYLFFSVGIASAIECQKPKPINDTPRNDAVLVALKPSLYVYHIKDRSAQGPCWWRKTYLQVVDDPLNFTKLNFSLNDLVLDGDDFKKRMELREKYLILDTVIEGRYPSTFTIPETLQPGKTYWWRVSLGFEEKPKVQGGGPPWDDPEPANFLLPQYTSYSKPTSFTTHFTVDGKCAAMPKPGIDKPNFGQPVSLTPTLSIIDRTDRMFGVEAPCRLDRIEWQLHLNRTFKPTGSSLKFTTQLNADDSGTLIHALKIPPGKLQKDTIYWWRARVVSVGTGKDGTTIYSTWPSPANFRTRLGNPQMPRYCKNLNTPSAAWPPVEAQVSLTPTLSVEIEGISPDCSWDETAWQIRKDDIDEYVYQTGFSKRRYTLKVPPGILKPGNKYFWRVKIVSRGKGPDGEDVYSDWSRGATFTTNGP